MAVTIQSVMHVNVNCSRLARSRAFYERGLGLASGSHTNPVPQDGAGFGLSGPVQWDAHILQDARGFAGPGIDLLEWKQPPPVGRPHESPKSPGFGALRLEVPGLEAVRAAAVAAGGTAVADARERPVGPGRRAPVLELLDPDGTRVQLEEVPGSDGPRLAGLRASCGDLQRSLEWYEHVLGLEARGGSFGSDPDEDAWSARRLWPVGQDAFSLDLVQWARPGPGAAYAEANHLGIYRMAFLVADMREAHAELLERGCQAPDPVWLDMGPDIPIEGLWACFFPDPDGACLELIESPRL